MRRKDRLPGDRDIVQGFTALALFAIVYLHFTFTLIS